LRGRREARFLQLAPYLSGLLIPPFQVIAHFLGMAQRPCQHGVDVGQGERVEGADDVRGACTLLIHVPDALQADARLADPQPAVAVVPKRDRDGFQCEVHGLDPPDSSYFPILSARTLSDPRNRGHSGGSWAANSSPSLWLHGRLRAGLSSF